MLFRHLFSEITRFDRLTVFSFVFSFNFFGEYVFPGTTWMLTELLFFKETLPFFSFFDGLNFKGDLFGDRVFSGD